MTSTPAGAPLRIAHGYGNSRELIRAALRDHVDVIEADVRLRRGRLWLAHDWRRLLWWLLLVRRAGWGFLALCSLLRGRRRPRVDSRPLPLEELPATVQKRCGLLLDLKSPRLAGNRRRFLVALLPLLRPPDGTTIRLCGDWSLLDGVRRVLPDSKLYYSVADGGRWRSLVRRLESGDPIRGVSLRAALYDTSTARFLADRGIEVFCWPVDGEAEAARVTALGAAGIIGYDLAVLAATGGAAAEGRR
jgi:glycerophosphoryl diester phosphodiesterase